MKNLELGKLGESIAKRYLENKGYKILEQNYKNKYGEIDLVARDKKILVFVEVKTRIGEQFGIPEDAFSKDKVRRLIGNAQAYIAFKTKEPSSFRIDAVCIVLDDNRQPARINHYESITS